jgi:Leucine-rich repeat (LRR) protein
MPEAHAPHPSPEGVFNVDLRGVHYDFLKARIPAWFSQAKAQRQQELAAHALQLPDWYTDAKPTLVNRHTRWRETLNAVETRLGAIEDVAAFAEPRLTAAIKQQFGLDLDVRNVYFARKYGFHNRNDLYGFFVFDQTHDSPLNYQYRGRSLLEAALANFEAAEETPLPCSDCQIITTWSTYDGEVIAGFDVLADHAVALAPHDFARMCRRLDLGAQYQAHIRGLIQPDDPAARLAFEQQLAQHQREQLALSLELANLHAPALSASARQMLEQLLANPTAATLDGKPVTVAALKMFDTTLVGPLLIGPQRQGSDRPERLVAYLPNDPLQPLKEYPSSGAFMADLRTRLHSSAYRRFFSRFVPAREQGTLFRQFNRLYQPVDGTSVSADYPPAARAPRLPLDEVPITGDLWSLLRETQVRKVFADARTVAVPTGDEDRQARLERLQGYAEAVVGLLNLAAFVVPGLGPVMLTLGAAQLTDEAFEGIEAYEHGEPREMWAHLASVALNVAAVGTGAAVLPQVQLSPLVDSLKPVTLDNGEQKLWRPDLEPYKTPVTLPADARPDALGLFTHEGKTLLAHEGEHYQVRHDPMTGDYRIQHPTRAHAYAPRLEHNHEGAWQHEVEHPLTWDDPTLRRRLGLPVDGIAPERVQQACDASGIEADALRATHLDHEPTPLVLADTLQRFTLADDLETFIAQLKSADPARYAEADPVLQMDLLQRRGMLSNTPLRVVGPGGQRLWETPAPASTSRRLVVLSARAMARGQLLQEVLYTLQGVDPALAQFPGQPGDALPVRANLLRQYLAEQAEAFKTTLVEDRYQVRDASDNPDVRLLQSRFPGLPSAMAEHLLGGLGSDQLQRFRIRGRLPEVAEQHARWRVQEVRVSRAYEGLFVESLANHDSQRLALHTLQTLPGWRADTRVELRQYSASGPLLDAIGPSDAAQHKTVVLRQNGQFEGPLPRDIYSALWHTLTAPERLALGAGNPTQLQALIQRAPLPRAPLRTLLLEAPLRKPAYDPSMRLLGGGLGIRRLIARTLHSPQERARRLFPTLDDAEINSVIESLGSDVSRELARLEAEYTTLERDLKTWVRANAPQTTATAFDRRGGAPRTYADGILRCWRREERSLKIMPGTPLNLPGLSAEFSHVETLSLFNIPWTGEAQTFLSHFKQLKQLTIERCALSELPEGLGGMPNLTHLGLNGNRIRLTPAGVQQLRSLSQLEQLDLGGNPLDLPPDLSTMPRLKRVDLSRTDLQQWPIGLREQTALEQLNLANNQLRTIPHAHLHPAPEHFNAVVRINSVTDLRGNPLSAEAGQALDQYWLRLAQEHPQLMSLGDGEGFLIETAAMAQVRSLFPDYSLRQARQYVIGLGDGAQAQLNRLTEEFSVLKTQLDAWVFSGGGARQRYARMGQVLENTAGRDDRYIAQTRILSCWRRELPHVAARDGTPIGQELDLSGLRLTSLPDLDMDFSHVGSLKLNNMGLSTSPEGFLSSFRGLRWLDMANNQLHELPPALGQMHGLTRLFLGHNRIRLSTDTVRVLAGRTTLRALLIGHNPLGLAPDFTQIADIRSIDLSNTAIDRWPVGLGQQPHLDTIALGGNQLTTLPDFVVNPAEGQLEQSLGVYYATHVGNNPLTAATVQQVRDYRARLQRAGLLREGVAEPLMRSIDAVRTSAPVRVAGLPLRRWTQGLSAEQVATRQAQWLALREKPGGDGFFRMLDDLPAADAGHADLQQRVWEVIDSITEHSAESETLREEMFTWAGRGACCDRAALSFSNVEIMKMVYRAKASATDTAQGPALLKLARGLFRLDEVEKIALADIAERTARINNDPTLSEAAKRSRIDQLEEVEIRLAYRYGLKGEDKLALPGQPARVQFIAMGNVKQVDLDNALARIRALDNSPEELKALLTRDFWKDYVANKYRLQFEAQSKPFHERMMTLMERNEAEALSSAEYLEQSRALQQELEAAETALIERLTRSELAIGQA